MTKALPCLRGTRELPNNLWSLCCNKNWHTKSCSRNPMSLLKTLVILSTSMFGWIKMVIDPCCRIITAFVLLRLRVEQAGNLRANNYDHKPLHRKTNFMFYIIFKGRFNSNDSNTLPATSVSNCFNFIDQLKIQAVICWSRTLSKSAHNAVVSLNYINTGDSITCFCFIAPATIVKNGWLQMFVIACCIEQCTQDSNKTFVSKLIIRKFCRK